MKDKELIEFATEFRQGVLDGRTPHMNCWIVSQPLSLLLSEMGIENEIVKFDIDAKNYTLKSEFGDIEHFCIKIGNKILDATASQFKGMPEVFYGSIPIWYKTK